MTDFSGDPRSPTPPPPPNMAPPPGYVAYGGQNYGAFGSFQRVGGLARTIGVLLMIWIPLQIISTIVLVSIRGKAQDFINGEISESSFEDSSNSLGLTTLLLSAVQIALLVLTMVWMFRIAKNLRAIGRVKTWGPGWAIGGWFLPPGFLYVIPYLMFRDLWKGSDPDSAPNWKQNPIGSIVHIWWILFGLAPLAFFSVTVGNLNVSNRSTSDLAENIDDTFAISAIASVVQIGAAVAFLFLVRQLTDRHRQVTREA